MGIDDWSATEAQNVALGKYDVSRGEAPDASTSEHARVLMAEIKALSDSVDERFDNFVGENIEVDGVTIENNDGTLTVVDVAIDGDTEDLLTAKIAEIEAAAETASGKAEDAETAAGQAADSATAAVAAVSDAVDAANLAAAQAAQAASAAARAQSGAAMAESAARAVSAGANLNWQRSEKASAVAIYPVPETVLEPTVDFIFTETGPASGDKGPENPSVIEGVENINVAGCGKNVIALPFFANSATVQGVVWNLDNETGVVSANGTASADSNRFLVSGAQKILLKSGNTYFLSGCPAGGSSATYFMQGRKINLDGTPSTSFSVDYGSGAAWTINEDCYFQLAIVIRSGVTVSNLVFKPQLELGSVATAFEPYDGADYTVNLGGTYYGGSIDLATGVMTVTHVKVVLTGAEAITWSVSHLTATTSISVGGQAKPIIPIPKSASSGPVCSHFPFLYNGGSDTVHFYVFASGGATFWYPDPDMTEAEWKAYLVAQYANGTPVTLSYEVAVPTTVQLSPLSLRSLVQPDKYVPRLNIVYTDAQAVQVGYVKSPIRSEYEMTQAIIATEGGE